MTRPQQQPSHHINLRAGGGTKAVVGSCTWGGGLLGRHPRGPSAEFLSFAYTCVWIDCVPAISNHLRQPTRSLPVLHCVIFHSPPPPGSPPLLPSSQAEALAQAEGDVHTLRVEGQKRESRIRMLEQLLENAEAAISALEDRVPLTPGGGADVPGRVAGQCSRARTRHSCKTPLGHRIIGSPNSVGWGGG